MRGIVRTAIVAALATSLPALAGPGYWSGDGPAGGTLSNVVPDPVDADHLYVTGFRSLFRSADAGASWQQATAGFGQTVATSLPLAVDAEQPQDVYAFGGTGTLMRSTNRALSWAPTGYSYEWWVQRANGLVDVPGSQGSLWFLVTDMRTGGADESPVLRSTDAGASFTPFGTGLPPESGAIAVAFDPADPDHVLLLRVPAAGQPILDTDPWPDAIYRSLDGGHTWAPVSMPAGPFGAFGTFGPHLRGSISFGPSGRVYAAVMNMVLRSDDGGASWTRPGMLSAEQVLAHPSDPDTLWFHRGELMRSADGGATASPVEGGLTANPSYGRAGDPTRLVPVDVTRVTATAGFPAAGSSLLVSTRGSGLFRSTDQGTSWQRIESGPSGTVVRALAVHPLPSTASSEQGQVLFAGIADTLYSSPSLYRTDGTPDLHWETANAGLRASQIRALAIDPTTVRAPGAVPSDAHVYAVGSSANVWTEPGYRNAGLFKSTDGGNSWTTIDAGLPTAAFPFGETAPYIGTMARAVVLDPRSCPAAAGTTAPSPVCAELPHGAGTGPLQRLYVTASGTAAGTHRIIRSDDAGASWAAIDQNPGMTQNLPHTVVTHEGVDYRINWQVIPVPLRVSRADSNVIYVGTFTAVGCTELGTGTLCPPSLTAQLADPPSGVFRSDDAGASWTRVSTGLPRWPGHAEMVGEVLSLEIDPADHDRVWVSITMLSVDPALRPVSIWHSSDGGASWQPASTGIPQGMDVRALAIDPVDGNRLYAAGAGTPANPGAVYRSSDGGQTWVSMSIGLPAEAATALAVDPHNPATLHAGTDTGVWSILQLPDADDDGIPDEVEALAPNDGDGNGDGIPDATQRGVGSTIVLLSVPGEPEAPASDAVMRAGSQPLRAALASGAATFVTADVVGETEQDCVQAMDIQSRPASAFGGDPVEGTGRHRHYPYGLMQFEVSGCPAAAVDLIFHGAAFDREIGWTLRFYGPASPADDAALGWHDFASRATRVGADRWRLSLTSNAFGSYRPLGDSILFVGGPACYDARVFFDGGFEAQSTAPPSCRRVGTE